MSMQRPPPKVRSSVRRRSFGLGRRVRHGFEELSRMRRRVKDVASGVVGTGAVGQLHAE
jgi:hypothetical protein